MTLMLLALSVFPMAPLLRRVWELRDNATSYDGCYFGDEGDSC
jgi:hypothetical protein